MSASLALKEEYRYFTYRDYASWDDDERFELIDGIPYAMAAPSVFHQAISREFTTQFNNFLKGKPCRVYAAPFDVCLNALGDDDDTVVQPDLLIICDRSKLDGKRCNGAPDMAIEIISRSSALMDKFAKRAKYQEAGVREYWIANPRTKTVEAYILQDGEYISKVYSTSAPVHILKGCVIDLTDVFDESE